MLSELMLAGTPTKREGKGDRKTGLSVSSFFPCAYRLYLVHTGNFWKDEVDAQQVLNMEDGWSQEEQAVQRLKDYAGVEVTGRQAHLTLGKAGIGGRPDGYVKLRDETYLWEFKAMNTNRFSDLLRWGISAFLNYKSQTQGYLVGSSLKKALFHAKSKDSNVYFDLVERLDESFILPIIEWCDKIILEGWVPEPEKTKYCSQCGVGCFGPVLDFSWMETADEYEQAQQYIKGKQFRDGGQAMMDEARSFFVGVRDQHGNLIQPGLMGDKDELSVPGLNIRRITQHRFDIDRAKIIAEFGPEGLLKVGEEKESLQYRFKVVD